MSTGGFIIWVICFYAVGLALACSVTENFSLGWRRLLIPFGPITVIGALIWFALYCIFAIGASLYETVSNGMTKEQL